MILPMTSNGGTRLPTAERGNGANYGLYAKKPLGLQTGLRACMASCAGLDLVESR